MRLRTPHHSRIPALGIATGLLCFDAVGQESLEALRLRRQSLQEQVDRIDAQIAQAERASEAEAPLKKRRPYFVAAFGIKEVNSAGGVEPFVTFINPDSKSTIKYINVRLTPYNAVGDPVASTISGQRTAQLQYTGPLEAMHEEQRTVWEPVWYNSTIDCLKIDSVTVVFTNGRTRNFTGVSVKEALADDLKNDCRYRGR